MRIRQNAIVFFSEGKENIGRRLEIQILERESAFFLDFPPFGPSVRFGPRSKAVLRGEGYAWTSLWWSSGELCWEIV